MWPVLWSCWLMIVVSGFILRRFGCGEEGVDLLFFLFF